MINKYLEQRVILDTTDGLFGYNSPIELEYYLVESVEDEIVELAGKKVYGIEIVKKIEKNIVEGDLVRNFSCCRESTKSLISKLANNTVTPMGLPYILDDQLGE